jgi:transglutaminase-like putative cysteine protease
MRASGRFFRSKKILPWLTAAGLCFAVIWVSKGTFLKRPPPEPPRPLVLQYGFTLRNATARFIRGVRFQVAAPVKQTATQQCEIIRCSRPFRLSRDRLGNQTLHFADLDFAPHAVRVITVKTTVLVSTVPRPEARPADRGYLVAGKFVECDHPDIRRLADRLKDRPATDTAAALFSWVHGGIRHAGYLKARRGALLTLQSRRGDCTGQADLFAALCRACGLPARCLAGYICRRSMALDPRRYHNWSEFYQKGAWHLADPQAGAFCRRQSEYIAMQIVGPPDSRKVGNGSGFDRFAVSSDAIEVRMNLPPAAASGGAV